MARDKVTVFEGVPTMYAAMLHHPDADGADMSTLRTCASGGSAMPVEIMRAFEEKFGCMVLEGYGLSETSPRRLLQPAPPRPQARLHRLRDPGLRDARRRRRRCRRRRRHPPGEIIIRGENVMKATGGRPDATAEAIPDGWFRSGDIATKDADGYYFIVDRKKDSSSAAATTSTRARSRRLSTSTPPSPRPPSSASRTRSGRGDRRRRRAQGRREGRPPDELRDFVKERLAAYKYPRQVWIVDALPKGPTGKILRREVHAPES